jgi:WD40 repeat protein
MKIKISSYILAVIFFIAAISPSNVFAAGQIKETKIPVYASLAAGNDVRCIAFSPDGKLLASGNGDNGNYSLDYSIKLWDVSSGQLIRKFDGHSKTVNEVVFSTNGKLLASAASDGTIRIWDVDTGKLIRTIKQTSASNIAFNSDSTILISNSINTSNSTVYLWDIATGMNIKKLSFELSVKDIACNSNNGDIAIFLKNGDVHIRDKNGNFMKSFSELGDNTYYSNIQYSEDGKYLAVSNCDNEQPILLEVDNNYTKRNIEENQFSNIGTSNWEKVMFSKNGQILIAISYYKLYFYNVSTGKLLGIENQHRFEDAWNDTAISEDLQRIATANYDGGVILLDSSGLELKSIINIELENAELDLKPNDKETLKVIASYDDGSQKQLDNKTIEWTTSDFNTCIVQNGTILAKNKGTAQITALLKEEQLSAQCKVTVTPPIKSLIKIVPSETTISLKKNETTQLKITGYFSDGSQEKIANEIQWDSSNSDVVMIDSDGEITALSEGTTTITALYKYILCKITINVKTDNKLLKLNSNLTTLKLAKGQKSQLNITGIFSNGTQTNMTTSVKFTSSNKKVVIVDTKGKVVAVGPGSATITTNYGNLAVKILVAIKK